MILFSVDDDMESASETSDGDNASEDEESEAEEPESPSPDKVATLEHIFLGFLDSYFLSQTSVLY